MWRRSTIVVVLGGVLIVLPACQTPPSSATGPSFASDRTDDAFPSASFPPPAFERTLRSRLRRMVAGMRRALAPDAAARNTPLTISVRRIENHTPLAPSRFRRLAERWYQILRTIGRRARITFRFPRRPTFAVEYTLRQGVYAVQRGGEGEDKHWLIRLVLIGPDAQGHRRPLYRNAAMIPAP